MSCKFKSASIEVMAPSNIAWTKYWGKKDLQKGINASLSMPLKNCSTKSKVEFSFGESASKGPEVSLIFEGENKSDFLPKINTFFERAKELYPFIGELKSVRITSENTFPHSSGIASSASAFAALALAMEEVMAKIESSDLCIERASSAARLGSGSACRSFHAGFTLWGLLNGRGSEEHGVKIEKVESSFEKIYDAICIVSSKEKAVGSSAGHALMENHPYKEARIAQANENTKALLKWLDEGNIEKAGEVLEEEALALHGLMATSRPSYILMRPETLAIIEKVQEFRRDRSAQVYFTLDAGPNPHIIYFESSKEIVESELLPTLEELCENGRIIMDQKGDGARIIESFFEESL